MSTQETNSSSTPRQGTYSIRLPPQQSPYRTWSTDPNTSSHSTPSATKIPKNNLHKQTTNRDSGTDFADSQEPANHTHREAENRSRRERSPHAKSHSLTRTLTHAPTRRTGGTEQVPPHLRGGEELVRGGGGGRGVAPRRSTCCSWRCSAKPRSFRSDDFISSLPPSPTRASGSRRAPPCRAPDRRQFRWRKPNPDSERNPSLATPPLLTERDEREREREGNGEFFFFASFFPGSSASGVLLRFL